MTRFGIFTILAFFIACGKSTSNPEIAERVDKKPVYRTAVGGDKNKNNDIISGTRQNAITSVVKNCSDAIVGISVTEVQSYTYRDPFQDFFGDDPLFRRYFNRGNQTYKQEIHGAGSGFVISDDGYVLTNDHVAGKASKIVVTMTNGKKYDAEIIGTDYSSDVALLKIKKPEENLPFLRLANSEDVLIGEWAIAFGNPFGLFDNNAKPTVTVGVVSNTGVKFSEDGRVYKNMIQTDAAISSGNSGGPLLNASGEVIGINTVIFSTNQGSRGAGSIGIGFAIPINRVKEIVDKLKRDGSIDRAFNTGLQVSDINERIIQYFRLTQKEGVIVVEVASGSSAEKAEIEPGDIILEINGDKVKTADEVEMIVNDSVVGQDLDFKLLRAGKIVNTTIDLKKRVTGRRGNG